MQSVIVLRQLPGPRVLHFHTCTSTLLREIRRRMFEPEPENIRKCGVLNARPSQIKLNTIIELTISVRFHCTINIISIHVEFRNGLAYTEVRVYKAIPSKYK